MKAELTHSWLTPLSCIYEGVTRFRNYLFDHQVLPVTSFSTPIVSIGNLTVGGTGKTPLIAHFIHWAQGQGHSVGVVSRGYRGQFRGVQRVEAQTPKSVQIFGDEPTMLALKFPEVPIYVCPDRVLAVKELLKHHSVDFVLADDAFQHRRLGRSMDWVVLDCTEKWENYQLLPSGRARESLSGLTRASAVILSKANAVSEDDLNKLRNRVKEFFFRRNQADPIVVESHYVLNSLFSLAEPKKISSWSDEPVLLVSGIGRPAAFLELAQKQGARVVQSLSFEDHHTFTDRDVAQILEKAGSLSVSKIVITEKDAVKLANFKDTADYFWVAPLELELKGEVNKLYDQLVKPLA